MCVLYGPCANCFSRCPRISPPPPSKAQQQKGYNLLSMAVNVSVCSSLKGAIGIGMGLTCVYMCVCMLNIMLSIV